MGKKLSIEQLTLKELFNHSETTGGVACPTNGTEKGSRNIKVEVCAAASRMIRESGKSRAQVADEMSHLAGEDITVSMLDGFTAPTRDNRFPAEFVSIFCEATGGDALAELVMPTTKVLIDRDEADLLDLGQAVRLKKAAAERERKILKRRSLR